MQYRKQIDLRLFAHWSRQSCSKQTGRIDYQIALVNDSSAGPKPKTLHEGQYGSEEIPTFRALQRSLQKTNRFPLAQF